MSLYQIIVMLVLMYFSGLMFFDEGVNLISGELRLANGTAAPRLYVDSLNFHTYVLMNLFNAINCRVVDANEKNVFKTLFNNPLFWFITMIEIGVQLGMIWVADIKIFSVLLGVAPLTIGMQITAWMLGASVLLVNIGIKFIPLHIVQKIPVPEFEKEDDNMITKFNKELRDRVIKRRDEVMSAGA